jgi:hypothetical protein
MKTNWVIRRVTDDSVAGIIPLSEEELLIFIQKFDDYYLELETKNDDETGTANVA